MKFKSILFATLALLISCETSNVDDTYTSPENVSFFISQDNSYTKGTPIDSAEELSNIGVFATLTQGSYADAQIPKPNFMFNKLVEHDGDKWVYNPAQQWSSEPGEQISFFAYAPFATNDNGITIIEKSGKMPKIRFQVPQTNTLQPDLMVATPAYDRVKRDGTVGLKFRHALAAISFSVKGDASRKITAVKLSNIVPAATLSLDSSEIAWSNPADRSSQLYNLGIKDGDTAPAYGGVSTSITASNGYLMMIPQEITDVRIEVEVEGEDDLIDLNFETDSEWVAGAKYNYIIDLETETISYDISQTSNCYIVKNTGITEVYIPVDQRINTFWHSYSGLCETDAEAYMISSNTEWNAEIEWCDNAELQTEATTVERYEGFIPEDSSTSRSFVCDGTKAVMKVTLPDNAAIGNILISVSKTIDEEKKILWSWHLWVTDYNPDSMIYTATSDKIYDVENGEIHRYTKDSDYWTTGPYANTFTMDRDLGSHNKKSADGLFYQWGRKDPFSLLTEWTTIEEQATFATAVQTPNTFYARASGWCLEPDDTTYSANNYMWYDTTIPNNDTNIFEKSLFDPSPLGWCVPVSAAYKEWIARHDYNKVAFFEMSGHILPTDGTLSHTFPTNSSRASDDKMTSFWFSDRSSESDDDDAHYHYLSDTDIWIGLITTAYGHRIRPVKIPNY